jgi:two-component system sensor histidine kinase UhpB
MQNDPWGHDGKWTGPPPFLSAQRVGLTVNWCANRIGKVASIRRIVSDLRPAMLKALGLGHALKALAEQFGEQTSIACQVEFTENAVDALEQSPLLSMSLFRIAQEALNNVRKHARATHVVIHLAVLPTSQISLNVIDNGQGIRTQDDRKPESFGILGMRERIRAYGGTLWIESRPEGGAALMVLIQLPGVLS